MGDQGRAGEDLSDQATQWLVSLDSGTADRQAFEAWRSSDPRNAAAFAQVAATWRRTADPRLSVELVRPGVSRQPLVIEPDLPASKPMSRRTFAGAAAVLLGLGAAGTFLAWPRRAVAATSVGERQTIRLPDGSHAMLNTDTRVSWRFEDGRDFWIERGEATLLVREAEKPFHIYSDPIDARLSAGKVNIRLDPAVSQFLVLAGQAATTYLGTLAQTLQAGHLLTVSEGRAQIVRMTPDAMATTTAWQRGEIVFNGMPLDQAVAEFNRYLPDKIVLQNAGLAATRLGGVFQIEEPDAFLMALQEGFGIGHRRQGNQILLFRARA